MNILNVRISDIATVYSGKPGCGCGCRGTYYSTNGIDRVPVNLKMVKRVLNKFQRLEKEVPGSFEDGTGKPRRITGSQDKGKIFYWETDTRYYWIHLKVKEKKK